MRYAIIIYQTLSPATTPEGCQYGAGLIFGHDLQPRWTCSGATADEARERMERFWATEQKSYGIPKAAPKPPGPTPAVPDPDPSLTGAYRRGSFGDVTPPIALDDPGDVV